MFVNSSKEGMALVFNYFICLVLMLVNYCVPLVPVIPSEGGVASVPA